MKIYNGEFLIVDGKFGYEFCHDNSQSSEMYKNKISWLDFYIANGKFWLLFH